MTTAQIANIKSSLLHSIQAYKFSHQNHVYLKQLKALTLSIMGIYEGYTHSPKRRLLQTTVTCLKLKLPLLAKHLKQQNHALLPTRKDLG